MSNCYIILTLGSTCIDVKVEVFGKDYTVQLETSFASKNLKNHRNVETSSQNPLVSLLHYSKPPVVECLPLSKEITIDFDVPINGLDPLSNNDGFELPPKTEKITRLADDESTTLNKNDLFEQWARKKKHLLELEVLEMRNYKIKLDLWEKEQQLQLACSKFTRDIKRNQ